MQLKKLVVLIPYLLLDLNRWMMRLEHIDGLLNRFQGQELDNFVEEIQNESWFQEDQPCGDDNVDKDEFFALDPNLIKEAEGGGRDGSKGLTRWARRRFDSWRSRFKFDCRIPIEEIPVVELADMLMKFMLQIKKKNKEVYPPGSLSVLYRTFGKILRKKQEVRVGQTGVEERPFNILKSDVFKKSTYAFVVAVRRSRLLGVKGKKKKAPVIPFSVENDLLADVDHQIYHPRGCQKRLCFYICSRFGIRAAKEIWNAKIYQFSLEMSETGEFVKYEEACSKNYNPSVTRFEDHHFRDPVWSYEEDFVFTYKQYVRHLPSRQLGAQDKTEGALFFTVIDNFCSNVWYHKQRVGINQVTKWLKVMGQTVNAEICNKSGRVTLVTRLALAGVPAEVGMQVTGHNTYDGFRKYDRSKEIQVDAAMSILSKPLDDNGKLRAYNDVLGEQMSSKRKVLFGVQDDRTPNCLAVLKQVVMASSTVAAVNSEDHVEQVDSGIFMEGECSTKCKKQVVCLAGKENIELPDKLKQIHDELDFIDEGVVNELMRADPLARKALQGGHYNVTKGNTVSNAGGQNFIGATFSGCVFVTCENPAIASDILKKLHST